MDAVQFPAPIGAASGIKLGYGKLDQMRRAEILDFSGRSGRDLLCGGHGVRPCDAYTAENQ
jgi:hypothetical protein